MSWTLASAEARAAAHSSFKIPSRSEREDLRVGDLAKLVFVVDGAGGERMWVEVTAVAAGRYRGILRNVPVTIPGIAEGDTVEFGPEHVADWDDGKDVDR